MANGETSMKGYVAEAFRQITGRVALPVIQVDYYPFAGLNHTIRIRKQRVYVRISDILIGAPPDVCRALAFILVARLFRERVPAEHYNLYRSYSYRSEVVRATDLARRDRGRKIISRSGGIYDLNLIFNRLNRRYFGSSLPKPDLGWSERRTKRVLGHHDDVHDSIVISRSLDDADIPEYLVEFVLFHEMLHLKHPARMVNGRLVFHSVEFRNDERRFARYQEALEALESIK